MSYTALALIGVVAAVVVDLAVARTRLLGRRVFWTAYAIIVSFQLLTNGVFTGLRIVRYDGASIIGSSTPADGPPPFLGDGRIAFAPVEDLLFGFALVLLSLVLWVWWGRRGVQRTPYAGPPRWWPGSAVPPSAERPPAAAGPATPAGEGPASRPAGSG